MEYHGFLYGKGAFVNIDGIEYIVTEATVNKFKELPNAKAYVEAIEYFAFCEIVKKKSYNSLYFKPK